MSPTPSPKPPARAGIRERLRAWLGTPGSQRRVLARNGLWESSSFAIGSIVVFFLTPFIVGSLGDSMYGIWEIIISLTGFLSFADIGVRPAAVHFIARHDARQERDEVNRFVNTAFLTFSGAGALVLALAVPLSLLLPRFWNVAEGNATQASIALLIVAGELALSLPFNAFSAVLVGKQRYDVLGVIRLGMLAIRTVAIVVALNQGLGLVALAVVVAAVGLLDILICTAAAFRVLPGLRFDPRLAARSAFARLLKYGGWAMVVIIAMQVIWATDALIIGRALSDAQVAYFAIGFKLAFYALAMMRVTARVLEPALGALHGLGDRVGIRRLFTSSVRTVLLLSGPVLVYLLVAGVPFLRRWMDDEGTTYAIQSAPVLLVMTFAVLPAIASLPLFSVCYGTNRVRPLALLVGLEALLNLGLSIMFVGPLDLGLPGVALGTMIPAVLVHAILLPIVVCRQYGVAYFGFLVRTWTGPLMAGGLTALLLARIVDGDAAYGYPALFGLAALTVLIYYGVVFVLRRLAPPLFGKGKLLGVEAP